MKKLFTLLCAVALCAMVISCGGKDPLQEKFDYFKTEFKKAIDTDNDEKGEMLTLEFLGWIAGLDEAEVEKVDKMVEKDEFMSKLTSGFEEAFTEEYNDDLTDTFEAYEEALLEAAMDEDEDAASEIMIEFLGWYGELNAEDTEFVDSLIEESEIMTAMVEGIAESYY